MDESLSASAKTPSVAALNGQPETEQNTHEPMASSAAAPPDHSTRPLHQVTQVREFREPPSATSAASDQNSTPTRSPSRSTAAGRTHAHHHHHQRQRQHQHRRTMSPTTPTRNLQQQQPIPSRSNISSAVKADDAVDDVIGGTAAAGGLARVHRRPAGGGVAHLPLASLSDPTASPSLSMRHHNVSKLAAAAAGAAALKSSAAGAAGAAIDASPAHRKRSKSESRRRRERKQIAAGELEVRQANETLMRYLRQCTEINDASLSGELEIDQTYDDRRVHRKTRSQRERRGFQSSASAAAAAAATTIGPSASAAAAALVAAGGAGAAGTGGVAGARGRLQLQNGLTSILNSLAEDIRPARGAGHGAEIYNPFTPVISPSDGAPHHMGMGSKMFVQHPHRYRRDDGGGDGDAMHGVVDGFRADVENGMEHNSPLVQSIIDMSCNVQRYWILLSNLCHGLLGGLAFAHLLLVLTTNPYDWLSATDDGLAVHGGGSALAHAYASSFYALAVVCLVSVFDRMDFCRMNSSFSEPISFRWIIVLMIYLATNILSLSTEATIEHNDFITTNSTDWMEKLENNRVLDVWNSLSIVRSVCALVGWLLVGMYPQDDLLFDHLAEMERHQLN